MSSEKDDEIAALKARLEALEAKPFVEASPPPPVPPAPAKGKSGCGSFVIAVCVIVAILFIVAQCVGTGDTPGATSLIEPAATAWTPPEGYSVEQTRNGGIGVKWDKPSRRECRGSGVTCFAMDVISEKGCPRNLYVSITLLSSSDRNIGWTNDTAQGVGAGEPVRLVFDTYEEGAKSARVAEVSCY